MSATFWKTSCTWSCCAGADEPPVGIVAARVRLVRGDYPGKQADCLVLRHQVELEPAAPEHRGMHVYSSHDDTRARRALREQRGRQQRVTRRQQLFCRRGVAYLEGEEGGVGLHHEAHVQVRRARALRNGVLYAPRKPREQRHALDTRDHPSGSTLFSVAFI